MSFARPARWLCRSRSGSRELVLFAIAYLTYFGVRAITEGSVAEATGNALSIVHLERAVGIDIEGRVQQLIVGSHTLVGAANAMYIYGHWPLLIVGGILLFHLRRPQYDRLRSVCLLSGAFGLIVFALFPVAPPRLAPVGLLDTITALSGGYRTFMPPAFVNEYAAMPSFHAGWNLVLGAALFRATRHVLVRAFALAMPAAMAFAVVATANHFVVDVVAGAAAVSVAFAIVTNAPSRPRPTSTLSGDVRSERHRRAPRDHAVRGGAQSRERPGGAPPRGTAASAPRGG
jgi:hypothetical protein